MQFDAALNLIWLTLGVCALASTVSPGAPVRLHVCGVALIIAALFPYISATDDVLRIQHMDAQQTKHHQGDSGKKAPNESLIRLYEAMDTSVVCEVQSISLVLLFVAMVIAPLLKAVDAKTPRSAGRSPPSLAFI